MPLVRTGQLARTTPTARLDDPIGLVAVNLRASNYGTIPVLDRIAVDDFEGSGRPPKAPAAVRVLGIIDERDLGQAVLPALARQEVASVVAGVAWEAPPPIPMAVSEMNGHHPTPATEPVAGTEDPDREPELARITARAIMRHDFGIIPAAFSLHNALLTLDRYNSEALPVLDAAGSYQGMVSRADIVAALGRQVRPPSMGGMATPLGVWLTTGTLNAGVPPWALALSGLTLAGCYIAAYLAVFLGLAVIRPDWAILFHSGRLGATSDNGGILNFFVTIAQMLLFLGAMRALPIAGYHAAEHQTVWAIEKGLPLEPEVVGQMPRAHPRCGTNLMALAALICILFEHMPSLDAGSVLLALVFTFFAWRNFGTLLQEYFTTKPATRKQLESGIRAGKELLEKYQEQPHARVPFGMAILNSGIAYSAVGMIVLMKGFFLLEEYLAHIILHV